MRRFALIIGAMKSGTTSLFEYLAAHPRVAPCSVKEPNFFYDDEQWAQGPDAYARLWDWDPTTHAVALEASTSYTKLPSSARVPERIGQVNGDFRFLYVMRDPVRRIVSHLTHTAIERRGAEHVGDDAFRWALGVSRYATQLDAYTRIFPKDTILPLVHEDLAADPVGTLRRALEFLDLDPQGVDRVAVERVHNARIEMAAGMTVARWVGNTGLLASLERWLPTPVTRRARTFIGRRNLHEVTLTPEQRARAVEVLHPEVRRIRDEWGVDTSPWDPSLNAPAAGR